MFHFTNLLPAPDFNSPFVLLQRAPQVKLDNKVKRSRLLESKHNTNNESKNEKEVIRHPVQTSALGVFPLPSFATAGWKRKFNNEHHLEQKTFSSLMMVICCGQIGVIVLFPGDRPIQFLE